MELALSLNVVFVLLFVLGVTLDCVGPQVLRTSVRVLRLLLHILVAIAKLLMRRGRPRTRGTTAKAFASHSFLRRIDHN